MAKCNVHEVDNSLPFSTEVRNNVKGFISTPPYAFVVWFIYTGKILHSHHYKLKWLKPKLTCITNLCKGAARIAGSFGSVSRPCGKV